MFSGEREERLAVLSVGGAGFEEGAAEEGAGRGRGFLVVGLAAVRPSGTWQSNGWNTSASWLTTSRPQSSSSSSSDSSCREGFGSNNGSTWSRAAIRSRLLRVKFGAGEAIYFVQQQLGHADIQTTIDQYGHPDKKAHREAAARAAAWWREAASE
jgi:hypothetical protein